MASIVNQASINYLRYAALGVGVWYGYTRQNSLELFVHKRQEQQAKHLNEQLVEEARIAYEAHLNKLEAQAGIKDNIVTDSNDYRFSADRWMNWALARTEGKQ